MANENKHLQHLKSNVVTEGKPKLPTSDALMLGEIAVNYAKGYETLSIKNSDNEITTFSSDNALAFKKTTNPSDSSKVGLVNSLSQYYDTNIGKGAVIEGDGKQVVEEEEEVIYNITASGPSSHAEGYGTTASGYASHAEGDGTTASNSCSHAEGDGTTASGPSSHAEGYGTTASDYASHAEGSNTTASGYASHAEGINTTASNHSSHAEGFGTTASGLHSHAEGEGTIANNKSEHASGQYNVSLSASTTFGDSGNTLFSVGNGTASNARHNAFEIRQNGDIYIVKDNADVKLQEVLNYKADTISIENYFNEESKLPYGRGIVFLYNGKLVEHRCIHVDGNDYEIVFCLKRESFGERTNNGKITEIAVFAWNSESEEADFVNVYARENIGADYLAYFNESLATIDTNGLMPKEDKIKLEHINIDSSNTLEINNDDKNIKLNTVGSIFVGNNNTTNVEIKAGSGPVAISSYQNDIELKTDYNGDIKITVENPLNAIILSVDNTELRLDETNLQKLINLLQNS